MKFGGFLRNSLLGLLFLSAVSVVASAGDKRVTTVAGGFLGDGGPAISASFALPSAVVRDSNGNLYVADENNCRIRRISAQGTITTFAGTGICGFSGDGGPAKSARIENPYGIALDQHGNLLIVVGSHVRSIAPNGTITTIAGNGKYKYSGDGGPATKASLNNPRAVSRDASDNIYIADSSNNVIRKVDASGVIHTVVGNGTAGFSGDGGAATLATLRSPGNVVVDGSGNLYISDAGNGRIRRVNATGTINTIAGNGHDGNTGSGGPATAAAIGSPTGLRLGPGKLYLSTNLAVIWTVDLATNIITTVAGNGITGFNGDGNSALSTSFALPQGMALDGRGGFFVADSINNRIRHIDANQIVSTVAGGAINDGGPAPRASLNLFFDYSHIAFDPSGNLYIADSGNCRIRKVSPAGTISTFAGTGICGYTGDGGPATSATLYEPQAVAADRDGNVYIADTGNEVIRKVDGKGTITTLLASLLSSGNAESARVNALATDSNGNLYASDGLWAIWKITPFGTTSVAAGVLFNAGYNGDGIPATEASLWFPTGITVDRSGNVYISDWLNNRIRMVNTSGIISTVAGDGAFGFGGDGGPATSAFLDLPTDVAVDDSGNIFVADWANLRVREIDASGTINTVAGTGDLAYNGNGVIASRAHIFPEGLAIRNYVLYFSDGGSYRVRKIY